jgi:hypothetical protein
VVFCVFRKSKSPGSLAENNLGNDITSNALGRRCDLIVLIFFSPKYLKYRSGDLKIPFWLKLKKAL